MNFPLGTANTAQNVCLRMMSSKPTHYNGQSVLVAGDPADHDESLRGRSSPLSFQDSLLCIVGCSLDHLEVRNGGRIQQRLPSVIQRHFLYCGLQRPHPSLSLNKPVIHGIAPKSWSLYLSHPYLSPPFAR